MQQQQSNNKSRIILLVLVLVSLASNIGLIVLTVINKYYGFGVEYTVETLCNQYIYAIFSVNKKLGYQIKSVFMALSCVLLLAESIFLLRKYVKSRRVERQQQEVQDKLEINQQLNIRTKMQQLQQFGEYIWTYKQLYQLYVVIALSIISMLVILVHYVKYIVEVSPCKKQYQLGSLIFGGLSAVIVILNAVIICLVLRQLSKLDEFSPQTNHFDDKQRQNKYIMNQQQLLNNIFMKEASEHHRSIKEDSNHMQIQYPLLDKIYNNSVGEGNDKNKDYMLSMINAYNKKIDAQNQERQIQREGNNTGNISKGKDKSSNREKDRQEKSQHRQKDKGKEKVLNLQKEKDKSQEKDRAYRQQKVKHKDYKDEKDKQERVNRQHRQTDNIQKQQASRKLANNQDQHTSKEHKYNNQTNKLQGQGQQKERKKQFNLDRFAEKGESKQDKDKQKQMIALSKISKKSSMIEKYKAKFREINPFKIKQKNKEQIEQQSFDIPEEQYRMKNLEKTYNQLIKQNKRVLRMPPKEEQPVFHINNRKVIRKTSQDEEQDKSELYNGKRALLGQNQSSNSEQDSEQERKRAAKQAENKIINENDPKARQEAWLALRTTMNMANDDDPNKKFQNIEFEEKQLQRSLRDQRNLKRLKKKIANSKEQQGQLVFHKPASSMINLKTKKRLFGKKEEGKGSNLQQKDGTGKLKSGKQGQNTGESSSKRQQSPSRSRSMTKSQKIMEILRSKYNHEKSGQISIIKEQNSLHNEQQ